MYNFPTNKNKNEQAQYLYNQLKKYKQRNKRSTSSNHFGNTKIMRLSNYGVPDHQERSTTPISSMQLPTISSKEDTNTPPSLYNKTQIGFGKGISQEKTPHQLKTTKIQLDKRNILQQNIEQKNERLDGIYIPRRDKRSKSNLPRNNRGLTPQNAPQINNLRKSLHSAKERQRDYYKSLKMKRGPINEEEKKYLQWLNQEVLELELELMKHKNP